MRLGTREMLITPSSLGISDHQGNCKEINSLILTFTGNEREIGQGVQVRMKNVGTPLQLREDGAPRNKLTLQRACFVVRGGERGYAC